MYALAQLAGGGNARKPARKIGKLKG
jgi:hypothetical protein